MAVSIALAGNPNSGKTTMFNVLTGSSQYVGNRPGVTVEGKVGQMRNYPDVNVVDLPGIYSLSPYTMEEVVTRNYLIDEHPDAIINLVDASNIERNLYLTTQLCEVGFPVVIALNMMDVAEKNGDTIHIDKLSQMLGCDVIPTSALKEKGLDELCEAAVHAAKKGQAVFGGCRFSPRIETALSQIEALISDTAEKLHMRWFVVKVFERDQRVMESLNLPEDRQKKIDKIITKCEQEFDDESDSIIINERYEYITALVKQCVIRHELGTTVSDKVDDVMTNRYLALPLFIVIMCGVYYISIQTVGGWAAGWMEQLIAAACTAVRALLEQASAADWMTGLVVDGLISGVGAVLSFVPQLLVLFLFLALLEDCGYMARIAFIMDQVFRRFGLSGKSFIPLLVASGCGVPGIMSCRTIESEKDRKITIMVTTFVPCGAKLPLIALIAGSLFGNSAWIAISVYFVGVLMVFLSGLILKKSRALSSDPAPFVMEMPSYHIPSAKNVARHVWDDIRAFVIKAGTIIFLACGIIWFLSNFAWNLRMTDASHSILADIGGLLAPLFRPLGFGQWQPAVATLTGIAAKENIVSSLNVLYGWEGTENISSVFTPLSGYAFLMFNMLCSPCVAAIGAIRREMGSLRWTLFALGYQTGLAYVVTFILYQTGIFIQTGQFQITTAVAVLLAAGALYLIFRRAPQPKTV
ncbi:ferrous iron transport protein B [Ructibacterium gallinarum]|uniref:Ferrous iron transport protein B n=1 Tax=Ructibacterium gallinarum TaxID=2779355 RepID=A0A9D5R9T8_9FIRM|nr:ferrous iron transport protein B [Ructibacterium gallinarum]MBE5040839.1 ferrous iron transport protein B [Ructibacterium gallinarum]